MLNAQQALQLAKNRSFLKENVDYLLSGISSEIEEAANNGEYIIELDFTDRFRSQQETDTILVALKEKLTSLGFQVEHEGVLLLIDWSKDNSEEDSDTQEKKQQSDYDVIFNNPELLKIAKQFGLTEKDLQKYKTKVLQFDLGDLFIK